GNHVEGGDFRPSSGIEVLFVLPPLAILVHVGVAEDDGMHAFILKNFSRGPAEIRKDGAFDDDLSQSLEADLAAGVFHEKTSNEVSEKRHRRLHGHPGFIENRPANHATERSDFINEGVLPFDFENQLDKEMT